ncbi:FAD-dependent oxidoreductase [Pigmentiphaga litoralis]|uniref:Choline dehydrogenase-like flavoprotein n=1 Tax=Pigmentiphaga litoralis TaxID=516702 RepID=A0A7Y9LQC9_9BURK|nr:GMC family oxidoreductase [Pigmentiphaga litoralis]NYE26396.1 choline dehydrogenase-like flavoprotein [Pigmentiphaga litoralis]NYE85516.1 choline dehydrogenase-like flavoprotein [Pigmentiphaga litoralis]
MIIDARDLLSGTPLSADICIVGAGAAGISMALALADSGLTVLLLESGGDEEDEATQALYSGEVADEKMHSPIHRYRMRRLGGSTTVWGGRCMPFDPIDFEARDYIGSEAWPVPFDEVAAYYPQANALCEAGDFLYRAGETFHRPLTPMMEGFESQNYSTDTLERFSCPTNFGWRYRRRLAIAPTVRMVLHANVTAIEVNDAGTSVTGLTVRTLSGVTVPVQARRYVLAVGGLETVRLLLNSPGASGQGIGNTHDNVGRYYMCHVAGTIGSLQLAPGRHAWHGYDVSDEGIYCRRRLALLPGVQRKRRIGNFVARLHHPRMTDPRHRTGILSLLCLAKFMVPYEYAKRLYGDEKTGLGTWLAHLRNVLLDIPGVIGFLWHWGRDRTLASRKFPSIIVHPKAHRYSIDFHAEQIPHRDSRVTLTDTRDVLGMRTLSVDWRYTPRDVETVQCALALLADDIRASGVGTLDYAPAEVEAEMTRYGAYGGHHIGTARMGADPATSVVNADGRVHELDNLYVAGSAVFPTSSQANPTLTIVAFALRMADHLTHALRAA